MAQFLGDIAGILEIVAIAAGFVLLHRARKEAPARLLQVGGWVLVIGGIAVGLCTTYFWFVYQSQGAFDGPYGMGPGMMQIPGGGMGPATMDPGGMHGSP